MNVILPSVNRAAEFIADLPVSESAGVTKPQMTAIPVVADAMRSADSRFRVTNAGRSTKSRGGYPQTDNSGNRIKPAPADLARWAKSMILVALPVKSPTVGLICPRAIFTNQV